MGGWVKVYRNIRENPYMRKPAYRAVWLELLLEAEHGMKKVKGKWVKKEKKEMRNILWKGERVFLKPGQLTCGMKQLSEWTGVPRTTCERILKCFESEEQVGVQASNRFSLITVKNWSRYQQSEEPVGNRWGTNGEPVGTPKECKNERMKNKKLYKKDLNISLVDKKTKQKRKSSAKKKKEYEHLGEFENVKLTKEQQVKLRQRHGSQETDRAITDMSIWLKQNNNTYKDYYAALLSWIRRSKEKTNPAKPVPKYLTYEEL